MFFFGMVQVYPRYERYAELVKPGLKTGLVAWAAEPVHNIYMER